MTQLTTPRTSTDRLVMPVVAVGVLLSGFDLFIVNVALGDIARAVGVTSLADLSWVLNAYTIAFAALLVPAGRLGDHFGSKRVFLAGLALFVLASALCATSPSLGALVGFRVGQAVGAALMIPSSLGVVLAATPPERRAGAVHLWAGLGGLGAALGPVVGGLLVHADWRWVFLINIPTGLIAIAVGLRVLPETPRHADARPGLGSALLLVVSVAALVGGLVNGSEWGWTSAGTLSAFAVAAAGIAATALSVVRGERPIVDLALLRVPHFAPMSVYLLVFHVAFGAMLLSVILWQQDVWRFSALESGLGVAPGPLLVPLVASRAGRLAARLGAHRVLTLGSLVFAAGVASWAVLVDPTSTYAGSLLPGMLLTGLGVGLCVPTAMAVGSSQLPPSRFSTGSAVLSTARQVGIALGVAALVAVLQGHSGSGGFAPGWWLIAAAATLAGLTTLSRREVA
ncbi:MFS transporter [Nocardioides nitrophenolicus]|uniref:MFS transporter n=1 Tax=Nocardioides nitrophenolicus TaxID=60489 RepID=UPI00195CDCD8|nr:MFS transporter [Nocardioides nitrophenolicus]MBM7520148.1 EmrB/QacA subfamily drug resistance transporter [Nocardioides nitrophenolicus]